MPNRNSYLVLSLSDKLRSNLYVLAQKLKNSIANIDNGTGNLDFDLMEFENIHITFFFTGELLHKLSRIQLKNWYDSVTMIINEVLNEAKLNEAKMNEPLMIQYTGFDVFPPAKSNLIVAKFDVSNLLHKMYQKIAESSKHLLGDDSSGLKLIDKLNMEWIPHCTLGKIRAPKAIITDIGNKVIKDILRDNMRDLMEDAPIDGLLMCGEIPKQLWIDWENSLKF